MVEEDFCPPEVYTYLGCCLFYLGQYSTAKDITEKGLLITISFIRRIILAKPPPQSQPQRSLTNRLLFHCAHKLGDEKSLMYHHSKLQVRKDKIRTPKILLKMYYVQMFQTTLEPFQWLKLKSWLFTFYM